MYGRIILADDGSALARAAIPRTAALAVADGSDVLVVRVSKAVGTRTEDLDDDGWDQYVSEEAAARAAASPVEAEPHLSGVVTDLRDRGVRRAGSLVLRGDAADALVEAAEELDAGLIVMSSHGVSGIRRAVLGSVAEHVIRHARKTPVLLSPPPAPGPEPGIRRVLLPLDGSDLSRIALPHAEHLARSLGAGLVLLQVIDSEEQIFAAGTPVGIPPAPGISFDTAHAIAEEQRANADTALRTLAASLRERGIQQVEIEVASGVPTDAIMAVVEQQSVDVVVMATHGRGGLGRLLLGSVADAVARQSERAAVLLVRPSGDE